MDFKSKEFLRFVMIFLITIVFLRVLVFIVQEKSLYIVGYEIHHLYIGVLLVIFSGFFRFFSVKKKLVNFDLIAFAVGCGMIVDELVYVLFTGGTHLEYFSKVSLLGTVILAVVLVGLFYLIFRLGNNK